MGSAMFSPPILRAVDSDGHSPVPGRQAVFGALSATSAGGAETHARRSAQR